MSHTPELVVVDPRLNRIRRYVGRTCTHEAEFVSGLNGTHKMDIFLYRKMADATGTPYGPFAGREL